MLPADGHVHSQFSWDAPSGDMHATCARAVQIGLPALAFTGLAVIGRRMKLVIDTIDLRIDLHCLYEHYTSPFARTSTHFYLGSIL